MFRKSKMMIIFAVLFLLNLPCGASDAVKINDLIENTAEFNSTSVTVRGEMIGEAMERAGYAWINISDGTNAIGIRIKQSDLGQIQFYGDYKHKGDIAEITGIFNNSCPAHGGDTDMHCTDFKIIEKGREIKEELSSIKVIAASISVSFTLLFLILYYNIMKKKAKQF